MQSSVIMGQTLVKKKNLLMQRSVTLISLVGRKKQLKTADVRKSVDTYRYVEVATGMKTAVKAIISILKLD